MLITILNEAGSVRWNLMLEKEEASGEWSLSERNTAKSLFKNPLTKGETPGKALDNFLSVEDSLLESL